MIEVELLKKEDEFEYMEFLSTCEYSMGQHALGWRNIIEEVLKDKSYYFVAKENGEVVGVLPTFIRENPIGNIMNSIPFAGNYGGVVTSYNARNRENIYEALLGEMINCAKEKGCILVSISTPIHSRDLDLYNTLFKPDYTLPNFFQYNNLEGTINLRKNIRRKIKVAIDAGVEITENDGLENIQTFYDMYKKRMLYLKGYIYPPRFFETVKRNTNNNSKFIFAVHNGKVVAGILLIFSNKIIDYFMAVMDMDRDFTEANSLLINYAMNWAKENNFKIWNWESSLSKESGVYKFKSRWGAVDGEHHYLTKVLGDLTALRGKNIGELKREYEWYFVMPYDQLDKI